MGYETYADEDLAYSTGRQVSLCELLDRVLNKGAVLTGEVIISIAGIEMIYVGVNLLVSSVETLLDAMDGLDFEERERRRGREVTARDVTYSGVGFHGGI